MHHDDILTPVLKALVERSDLDPALVEDVVTGCVSMTDEQGGNIGRLAVLAAGFPVEVPAFSLNRMCGSSQQAIHSASQAILAGDMDITIACGVENMTRVPMGSDMGGFSNELINRHNIVPQGFSAEMIASNWELERDELDAFSLEKLAGLTPSFQPDDGVITAGNSSQISDGAAGVLLMSDKKAKEFQVKPRAKIIARTVVGEDPVMMLTGVIPATKKVLQKAGLQMEDIDVFEINEAFASVVKAWEKELQPDMDKVNPRGGAIALGHPLGASGARISTTLLHELEDTGGKYGLQVMCIGFGMATATIIECI